MTMPANETSDSQLRKLKRPSVDSANVDALVGIQKSSEGGLLGSEVSAAMLARSEEIMVQSLGLSLALAAEFNPPETRE